MTIGLWWFVYPREITTAAFIALGAMPDLPRQWWLRLPMLASLRWSSARWRTSPRRNGTISKPSNDDFGAILKQFRKSPKLMYLVFDHSGSARRVTPYIHMPAWVQAQKGGWLSFHFAGWGDLSPIPLSSPRTRCPSCNTRSLGMDSGAFRSPAERRLLRYISGSQLCVPPTIYLPAIRRYDRWRTREAGGFIGEIARVVGRPA